MSILTFDEATRSRTWLPGQSLWAQCIRRVGQHRDYRWPQDSTIQIERSTLVASGTYNLLDAVNTEFRALVASRR